MSRPTQECSLSFCKERSVPGLKAGEGLCQYHWDKAHWGAAWALRCKRERELKALNRKEKDGKRAIKA